MRLLKKIKWSDLLIIAIGVGTFFFVREVLRAFRETGMEPSALVTAYFAFVTAELAILWQMHNEKKKRERLEVLDVNRKEEDIEIIDLEEAVG